MPTISSFPRGFLNLLGLQTFGENPRVLNDTVSPTVDIGELYLSDKVALPSGTGGALANGFNPMTTSFIDTVFTGALAVPVGEVWRLDQVAAYSTNGAGVTSVFAPALRFNGGSRTQLADPLAAAASTTTWRIGQNMPLFIPAGWELGIEAALVVGASTNFGIQAIIRRLRA